MITTHQFAKSKLRTTFSLHIKVILKDLTCLYGIKNGDSAAFEKGVEPYMLKNRAWCYLKGHCYGHCF